MAGVGGLEPPQAEPESAVLPLHNTPKTTVFKQFVVYILHEISVNINNLILLNINIIELHQNY